MTSRAIPTTVQANFECEATGLSELGFLEITHPNLNQVIRIVSDVKNYVWRGETWLGLPFEVLLLSDTDRPPTANLRVQNVDRRIGQAIRDAEERARIGLFLLTTGDFNLQADPREEIGTATPIYQFTEFELRNVKANSIEITGQLFLRDFSRETWPWYRATSDAFPGLYA